MWLVVGMHRTWLVARHEFGVMLSRTAYRLLLLAVPLVAVLGVTIFAIVLEVREDSTPDAEVWGYVDNTLVENQPLFRGFHEQGNITFGPFADEQAGLDALLAGDIKRLFVVPRDYLATGAVIEVQEQTAGLGDIGGDGVISPLKRFLQQNLLAAASAGELAERAIEPANVVTVEVDPTGTPVDDELDPGTMIFFLLTGVLLMISLLTTGGYLLQGLSEEKENRIMEVLLTSVRPTQLMNGKLLGLGAAGLMQVTVWGASGFVAFLVVQRLQGTDASGAPDPANLAVALAYFILGYFLLGSLMAGLGAITTSSREAQSLTTFIVLPMVVPMWFLETLIGHPDQTLARVLSFIPVTAPTASMARLAVGGMAAWEIALSLAILAGGVGLSVMLAARLFQAYLLSYGQRPSVRQVVRTLLRP